MGIVGFQPIFFETNTIGDVAVETITCTCHNLDIISVTNKRELSSANSCHRNMMKPSDTTTTTHRRSNGTSTDGDDYQYRNNRSSTVMTCISSSSFRSANRSFTLIIPILILLAIVGQERYVAIQHVNGFLFQQQPIGTRQNSLLLSSSLSLNLNRIIQQQKPQRRQTKIDNRISQIRQYEQSTRISSLLFSSSMETTSSDGDIIDSNKPDYFATVTTTTSATGSNATNAISIVPSINMHSLMVAVDPTCADEIQNEFELQQQQQQQQQQVIEPISISISSSSSMQIVVPSSGTSTDTSLVSDTTTTDVDILSKKKNTIDEYKVPSYKRLLIFCSTTFLIWLSEPLLSLVDTTVVGLTQGTRATIQIAALGPATTLIDSMLYLTYFLAIATTNQIAAHYAVKDYKQLQRTVSTVLGVALGLGTVCTLFVFAFAQPLLTSMAGLSGTVELIKYSTMYSYIRGSVATISVMSMTMQAICLATLNTKTPCIAVLAASITNIIGDITLQKYGVIGAAIATAASTIVSGSILFYSVQKKFYEWKNIEQQQQQRIQQQQQQQQLTPVQSKTIPIVQQQSPVDDNAADKLLIVPETSKITKTKPSVSSIPLISLPDRKGAIKLLLLSGPIFFVIVSKIACYSAMTLRCTNFGVEALAAQSIMMRIFFFYGCFGDSLSQTAQSFLPSTLYPKLNISNFRTILQKLFIIAGSIGIINRFGAITILRHIGQYLTKDPIIIQLMRDNTFFIGYAILLHPFIVLLEGTVIASRDFSTLLKTYTTTVPLHFIILTFFCKSFPAVWRTFFFFQLIRLVVYTSRVAIKQINITTDLINQKKLIEQQKLING